MSETEQFYAAIASKFGVKRKWHELRPVEQHQFMRACDMMLQVLHD